MALQMLTLSHKGNVLSKIYHGHHYKLDNTMTKGSDLDVGIWKTQPQSLNHIVHKL